MVTCDVSERVLKVIPLINLTISYMELFIYSPRDIHITSTESVCYLCEQIDKNNDIILYIFIRNLETQCDQFMQRMLPKMRNRLQV